MKKDRRYKSPRNRPGRRSGSLVDLYVKNRPADQRPKTVKEIAAEQYPRPKRKKKKRRRVRFRTEPQPPRPTKTEMRFASFLTGLDIDFEQQKPVWVGYCWRYLDFFLPASGLGVELDGAYHGTEEQRKADKKRSKEIRRSDRKVKAIWRLWNRDAGRPDSKAVTRLLKEIDRRSRMTIDEHVDLFFTELSPTETISK